MLFIPDPDPDFYSSRIQDPGVKKAPDPGSGSATLFDSYFKSLTTVKYGTVVCLNLFDTGGYFLSIFLLFKKMLVYDLHDFHSFLI